MKSRSLFVLGVGVTALSLFAVACGDDDDPAPANNTGKAGSAGSAAGSAGAAGSSAGSAGATAGGSAGATAGGSAGATAGGSAGATAGGSAGATAGGSAGATAGGSAGATAGGAAGATGGSAGAASGKKFGLVSLSQSVAEFVPGTKTITTTGIASFQGTTSTGSSTTTCKTSTEGACSIIECETADGAGGAGGGAGAGGAPASPAFLSAGDITITGLKAEVKLTFKDATSGYNPFSGTALLWDGGETGKIAAVGTADVPAFNGETTAPATVVFSKPAPVALGSKIPVDSTAAFDLAWDADAKGKINLGLTTLTADSKKTTSVNCSFDGAAKTASVPASVTAKLQKGGNAVISIGAGNTKVVTAGDYDVNLTLTNSVISGLAEVK